MPEPEEPRDARSPSDDALARQQALSDRLRRLFDHVVDESVPDDFKELLAKLTDEPAADPVVGTPPPANDRDDQP